MRKKALVTGCAGFIGSHLCEKLIKEGFHVIGIDCFTDYYSKSIKKSNLSLLISNPNFIFIEGDLIKISLKEYLKDVEFIFHQAGQPGVRGSWGKEFDVYIDNNIFATQILLEEAKDYNIKKFVYASSSSVYGNTNILPMKESQLPEPFSPYGVTKLAAEQLCHLYYENYGLPVISLRYFTVFGPRQRPEMAISSFIRSMFNDKELVVYGDGNQVRDFTYIDDIVSANLLAAYSDIKGEVFNVASQNPVKLIDVIYMLEKIIGKKAIINFKESQKGDVKDTYGDISKIKKMLGYNPYFDIEKGLANHVKYMEKLKI
ncbi:NAD-dependent epimerase/dehydratase family protein [Tepidibacter formicigenes]|jgi:UDP-glucose 4-epimerase|uniref:UDP-glucose 4-epimerase n=1 Tax=Tepidibacter formicigenes DSM 15518 TaxID=1123349 RepID=A0A1M6N0S8_9FIRM|nr:NAD-dependent epimerase/dehydratase family protein [Tepidibacter formicigenes]SHJ89305.1 UDP-glucose 4-epimerase [Tepidibacter formicigenes DSM 15518]